MLHHTQTTWAVIEDDGGGLHLYVFDGDEGGPCIYAHHNYRPDQLREDVQALRDGRDARCWDGCEDDPQGSWDEWTDEGHRNGAWRRIADSDGVYPEQMGAAGAEAFDSRRGPCRPHRKGRNHGE